MHQTPRASVPSQLVSRLGSLLAGEDWLLLATCIKTCIHIGLPDQQITSIHFLCGIMCDAERLVPYLQLLVVPLLGPHDRSTDRCALPCYARLRIHGVSGAPCSGESCHQLGVPMYHCRLYVGYTMNICQQHGSAGFVLAGQHLQRP